MKKNVEMVGKPGKGKLGDGGWYKNEIHLKQRPGKTAEENARMHVSNFCRKLRRKGFKVSQKKQAEGGYQILIDDLDKGRNDGKR